MRIRLHDIPEDGKAYSWNRKTGEINAILSDLIGNRPYEAEFFIKPINHRDFTLTGSIKSGVPEECSRCGIDFDFAITANFNEILIPHQEQDRTGRYTRVNHISEAAEAGPSSVEYDADDSFNIGEYLHEQVAISVPFNPAPTEDAKGDCRLCGKFVRGKLFSYDETLPVEKPKSPFAVLKDIKLEN